MGDWSLMWLQDGTRAIGQQYEVSKEIKAVVDLVAKIRSSSENLFFTGGDKKRKVARATATGELLLICLRYDLKKIERYLPRHRFSPLYTVFKHCSRHLIQDQRALRIETIEVLNNLVRKIRKVIRGPAFVKRMDNLKRSERENARSARKLLDELRTSYSKVLALRLDLEYYSEFTPGRGYQELQIPLTTAQQHRDQFLQYLRRGPYAAHLAGYIWRLEYGFEKGYHLHVSIFLDGQFVCKDINICDALGDYWRTQITDQKGYFHNCNRGKDRYPECGIGMLNRSDDAKWSVLSKVVRYQTKTDYYVRFRSSGQIRTFGIGGVYKR